MYIKKEIEDLEEDHRLLIQTINHKYNVEVTTMGDTNNYKMKGK